MIAGEGLHSRCATNYPKRKRQSMMITNEISDDYEKRMNSMMKTVMIVGEGARTKQSFIFLSFIAVIVSF